MEMTICTTNTWYTSKFIQKNEPITIYELHEQIDIKEYYHLHGMF